MAVQTDERFQHTLTRAFEQFFGVAHVDKATRDDIGTRQWLTRLLIYSKDDHQDTVLSKHLAVTQYDLPNIANPQSIDEDVAAWYMSSNLDGLRGNLDDIPILAKDDVIFRNTDRVGQLRV